MAQRYIPRNVSLNTNVKDVDLIDVVVDMTKVMAVNAAQVPSFTNRILDRGWDVLDTTDRVVADCLARTNNWLEEGRRERGVENVNPYDVQALTEAYIAASKQREKDIEGYNAFVEQPEVRKELKEALDKIEKVWNSFTEEEKKDPILIKMHEDAIASAKKTFGKK